jgi:hypothetical protein
MTFDPNRNDLPPDPYRDYRKQTRAGAGAAILLGALLLAAIGGFIYFYSGVPESGVATNDTRPPIAQPSRSDPVPETTGSSANMPPAPAPKLEPKVKPVE